MNLTPEQIERMRQMAKDNLFFLARAILGFDEMSGDLHWDVCRYLQRPSNRKLLVLPRGFFKTTLGTKSRAIQKSLQNPGISQLIACQIITNAKNIVDDIRQQWERNELLRTLFPELIPEGNRRWNSEVACLRRPSELFNQQEATYEAAGIGTQLQSRHYDAIYADDLIVPRKDQVTGVWMQPTEEDIQKAIGWHQMTWGLMRNAGETEYSQIMTRWCPGDMYDYLMKNEGTLQQGNGPWDVMIRSAVNGDGTASFPEKYPLEVLEEIRASQGEYKYSTQYLCRPIDQSQLMFAGLYNVYYRGETPENWYRVGASCDPAISKARTAHETAIVVAGMAHDGRRYVLDAVSKKLNPSETIEELFRLWRKHHFRELALETIAYQEALKYDLEAEFRKMGQRPFRVVPVRYGKGESKPMRIVGLQPSFNAGWWFIRSDQVQLMDQLDQYPMVNLVDLLDAMAMLMKLPSWPSHRGWNEEYEQPGEPITDSIPIEDVMASIRRANKGMETRWDNQLRKTSYASRF